jgi:hypothetical protein
MVIDPVFGTIYWTPTVAQVGSQAVTLKVIDGQGGSATQPFTVTVHAADQPPRITSSPLTFGYTTQLYNYQVISTDPMNLPLTYSVSTSPTTTMSVNSLGLVSWTPSSTQAGTYTVTVQVQDTLGGTSIQSYSLLISTPINQPPVITSTPILGAAVGLQYRYQVTLTDPENDGPYTYLLVSSPGGMSVNSSGLVTWTPTSGQTGSQTVTLQVTDNGSPTASAQQTFTIATVSNAAPAITSTAIATVTATTSW